VFCDVEEDQPVRVNLDTVVEIEQSTDARPLPPNSIRLETTTSAGLVFQCDASDWQEWWDLLRELSPQLEL
jgi:hypothetical protein